MSNQLQFQLVSPQKRVCDKGAAMVTVPGSEGVYGVLFGHAPMATTLQPGVVELYEAESSVVTDRWFVSGGFCEVVSGRCTVMADDVLSLDSLKREEIEAEVKALSKNAQDEGAARKLALAEAKLQAIASR